MARFDRRVQFLRAALVDDGFQSKPGAFVAYGPPRWGAMNALRSMRSRENFRSDRVQFDAAEVVQVMWSDFTAEISIRDRLVCDGVTYAITGREVIGIRNRIEFTLIRLAE